MCKRKLDVNHVYIYPFSFSEEKGSFILSHTFKISFKAYQSAMLCCKTTVAFAQHVMQRFEPNLVWLQLKCHITHHLLTYIEY